LKIWVDVAIVLISEQTSSLVKNLSWCLETSGVAMVT